MKQITKHIGQNLLILLLALLTLGLTFLLILDLIPADFSGFEVKEKVTVSSSSISAGGDAYISSVRGSLRNTTDKEIEVEKITLVVSNEKGESKTLEIEGETIRPRTDLELSYLWEGTTAYDRISSVTLTVDGEEDLIPNSPKTFFLNASTIICGVLIAVSVFFLVWVCKVRYYMYQEDKAENADA